jgi:hypothetical protein
MLTGCGAVSVSGAAAPTKPVPDTVLAASLLSADELNTVMSTTGMTPHNPVLQMADNRNLLPNLNCLGVWQVNQSSIYESSNWKSVRQQLVRAPDDEQWNFLVVQSVVSYRTADAAHKFLTESADRWSKCTNHTLNIQLNGQTLPKWVSGDLTKSDTELAMPYTRGTGDQTRSCQHSLTLVANLILDVQACRPQQQSPVSDAVAVAAKITSKLPQ